MSTLRSKLIRLAHSNPKLRSDLLPIIKGAADEGFSKAKSAAQTAISSQEKTTKTLKDAKSQLSGIIGAGVVDRAIGESEALEGRLRDLLRYLTKEG